MGGADRRILVATGCLSGISLQRLFTPSSTYDLAWNPRAEQRGRWIGPASQQAPEVRFAPCSQTQDNPIDGFVLQVILRKAEAIQRLGVMVPLRRRRAHQPGLVKALMRTGTVHKTTMQQTAFDWERAPALQAQWQETLDKTKANRTVLHSAAFSPTSAARVLSNGSRHWAIRLTCSAASACVRLGALENAAPPGPLPPRHLSEGPAPALVRRGNGLTPVGEPLSCIAAILLLGLLAPACWKTPHEGRAPLS